MKFLTIVGLAVVALAGIQTANAATFDFVAEADKPYDAGVAGEQGFATYKLEAGGIKLEATGKFGSQAAFAYLDKGNAGLGVCKILSGPTNQCNPSNDDNVTLGETLILTFDQMVSLDEVTFRDGGHHQTFDPKALFELTIDGILYGGTGQALVPTFYGPLVGKVFEFANFNADADTDNDYQFYISTVNVSAVPIPAAIWLFGSAMLGFVGIRRNNKKPA